jgi:hypothetical protein
MENDRRPRSGSTVVDFLTKLGSKKVIESIFLIGRIKKKIKIAHHQRKRLIERPQKKTSTKF